MCDYPAIRLGCGLIRIGREWGYKSKNIPSLQQAQQFLQAAVELGIRFFETAPSYGSSEQRLGWFLETLPQNIRSQITIATKCGEHWDAKKNVAYVDHSYSSLLRSIDTSLSLLGRVDILQLHKATPNVLKSKDVHKAFGYARSRGIKRFGVSLSDLET